MPHSGQLARYRKNYPDCYRYCYYKLAYISPSLKSHIQPFPITYTDYGKRRREANDIGEDDVGRINRSKKEHKKSFFELSHILFKVPNCSGELCVHGGRGLFPEVVAFNSTV